MSATAVRMGQAFVEIGTKLGPAFEKGMKQAGQKLKAFGASVARVGAGLTAASAAVLAPLTGAVMEFAKAGDQLNKMAQRTGIAVEQLSALKFAAEQSGSSIEDLETGVKRMQRTITDAGDGMASAVDALGAIGLTSGDLQGMSPDEQFIAIAQALSEVEDATTRAALAQEIFGRSGTMLLPLINGGAKSIAELTKEAEELGIVMSAEAAQSAAEFTDAWNRAKQTLLAVSREIAAAVVPAITDLIEMVRPFITSVIQWIKENQRLVVTIAAVAAALGGVGVVLTTVGGAIAAAGVAISALSGAFTVLTTVVGAVLSPIGLIVVGVTAAAAAAIYYSGVLTGLGKIFGETFGGMISALQSGDLELAWEIAALGMEAIWERMLMNIRSHFIDMLKFVMDKMRVVTSMFPEIQRRIDLGMSLLDEANEIPLRDVQRRLSIAIDNANTEDITESPAEKQRTKAMQDLTDATEEAAEAQAQAAKTIQAAIGQQQEAFTNGGVGAGANGGSRGLGARGATNSAAAAMLASSGKSLELKLLEQEVAILRQVRDDIRQQSRIHQMAQRNGWGMPVVGGNGT